MLPTVYSITEYEADIKAVKKELKNLDAEEGNQSRFLQSSE